MEEKASNPLVKGNTTDTLMCHSKGARDREYLWAHLSNVLQREEKPRSRPFTKFLL